MPAFGCLLANADFAFNAVYLAAEFPLLLHFLVEFGSELDLAAVVAEDEALREVLVAQMCRTHVPQLSPAGPAGEAAALCNASQPDGLKVFCG